MIIRCSLKAYPFNLNKYLNKILLYLYKCIKNPAISLCVKYVTTINQFFNFVSIKTDKFLTTKL